MLDRVRVATMSYMKNTNSPKNNGSSISAAWRLVARALAEQEGGIVGAEVRAALEADSREELAVACLFIKWLANQAPFDLAAMMSDFDDFIASQEMWATGHRDGPSAGPRRPAA
jgi:hypothetical protein